MSYTLSYAQGGLPAAADYIRSKGRNEDTQLIHMTPGEVDALQQMAVQHGGSLTINPHTGLPEAGFLKDLLKVALPVGLAVFGGPLAGSLGSSITGAATAGALETGLGMGLLSGGLGTLMTGDIKKGLGMGVTSGLLSGAMASFNAPKIDPTAVKTPLAAQAIPQATAESANQSLTSMMQNPSILDATKNPIGGSLANAQSAINAQAAATPAQVAQQVAAKTPAPSMIDKAGAWWTRQDTPTKLGIGAAGLGLLSSMSEPDFTPQPVDKGNVRPYTYSANQTGKEEQSGPMYDQRGNAILDKREQSYYTPSYTAQPVYAAAQGGLMAAPFADRNMYPQGQQVHTNFATPTQMPTSDEVVNADYGMRQDPLMGTPVGMAQGGLPRDSSPTGNMSYINGGGGWAADYYKNRQEQQQQQQQPQAESYQYTYDPATQTFNKVPQPQVQNNLPRNGFEGFGQAMFGNFSNDGLVGGLMGKLFPQLAQAGGGGQYQYNQNEQSYKKMAGGGLSSLGSYSDGGRMLKGPGDGMSDDIPAQIGKHQPARLADGEFVVPADVVSHLGNGSTDAGAKRLYGMMDKVRQARTGNKKQGKQIKAEKYLPT